MSSIDLSSIVAAAYDAALNDALWTSWAENLFRSFAGSGGLFCLHNTTRGNLEKIITWVGPAPALDEYTSGYIAFDPQIPVVSSVHSSCAYRDTPGADLDSKDTVDYLRWQYDIAQMRYSQTGVIDLGMAPWRVSLCIHKKRELGAVIAEEYRAMKQLVSDLQPTFSLAFRHNEMLASAFWDGTIAGRSGQISLLLDERGNVIRHSAAADALIAKRDGLDITARRLNTYRPSETTVLDAIIAQAIDRAAPQAGAMRVSRASARLPLILVCYPLPRRSRMLAPFEAAALVTVTDPHAAGGNMASLHRAIFGFTSREADLAAALIGGHSPESAAALLNISVPTARTHLRRLFEKTQTRGQPALMRLLTSIG